MSLSKPQTAKLPPSIKHVELWCNIAAGTTSKTSKNRISLLLLHLGFAHCKLSSPLPEEETCSQESSEDGNRIQTGRGVGNNKQYIPTFKEIWELSEDLIDLLPVEKSRCTNRTYEGEQEHYGSHSACDSTRHIVLVFFFFLLFCFLRLLRLTHNTYNCIILHRRKPRIPNISEGMSTLFLFLFSLLLQRKLSSILLPLLSICSGLLLLSLIIQFPPRWRTTFHFLQHFSLAILQGRGFHSLHSWSNPSSQRTTTAFVLLPQ